MEYQPQPHEDMSTVEEIMLSAPYRDVESWEKILALQIRHGTSRFRGPPGVWEVVAARLSSSMEPDRIRAAQRLPLEPGHRAGFVVSGVRFRLPVAIYHSNTDPWSAELCAPFFATRLRNIHVLNTVLPTTKHVFSNTVNS